MADEDWEELSAHAELGGAMKELRSETMPDSVAERILQETPPPGGGGTGGPEGGGAPVLEGAARATAPWWGLAAVAVIGAASVAYLVREAPEPPGEEVLSAGPPTVAAPDQPGAPPDSFGLSDETAGDPAEQQEPREPRDHGEQQEHGLAEVRQVDLEDDADDDAHRFDDIQLLEAARNASSSRPTRALRLLRLHARRFPNSQFAQERDVLRIEANLSQGRRERARSLADRFLERYGSSAQRGRVEALRARASAP